MKPSQQIRNIMPAIAQQRLAKAQQMTMSTPVLLTEMDERRVLANLGQEPLSWVMAIMAYLDLQQEQLDKRHGDMAEEVIANTIRLDKLEERQGWIADEVEKLMKQLEERQG